MTHIAPDSLFAGTDLALGMRIETINGSRFTYEESVGYLKTVVGQVVIEASYIAPVPPANASSAQQQSDGGSSIQGEQQSDGGDSNQG